MNYLKKVLQPHYLVCYALIVITACNSTGPETGVSQTILPQHVQEIKDVPAGKSIVFAKTSDQIVKSDFLEEIPHRVIDASVLPGVEFKQIDLMGYEKVQLPTGDRLLVINWGCESYNLTFRFETARFGIDTSKVKQWYSILTQLLYVIEPAVNSPVKIQTGINEIQKYLKQDTVPFAYNVSLPINNDSTISDLVFERVKVLGDSAVRLDATFSITSL